MTAPFRRPTRLLAYDYGDPGPYFITLCLNKRTPRFGMVSNEGTLVASSAGEMIARTWCEIPNQFPSVELDAFVAMPDHVHGILTLHAGLNTKFNTDLIAVIDWFKTVTVTRYGKGVRSLGWAAYDKPLWQRSFYDHIVRNVEDMKRCRDYIAANPARWAESRPT